MTIGGSTVASPFYDGGWQREYEQVGGDWRYLDGSRGRHHITAQWRWSVVWRVTGSDYTTLIAALAAVAGTTFSLTDHLANTETVALDGAPVDKLIGNSVHEVSVVFVETTA